MATPRERARGSNTGTGFDRSRFRVDIDSVRLLLGATIPFLLSVLIAPEGNTRTDLAVARLPARSVSQVSPSPPAFPVLDEGDNLRVYLERASSYLDDPRTMYYVSQALEECYAWGAEPDDDELRRGHVIC